MIVAVQEDWKPQVTEPFKLKYMTNHREANFSWTSLFEKFALDFKQKKNQTVQEDLVMVLVCLSTN